MKIQLLLSLLFALTNTVNAQTRWSDLTPEERAAKLENTRAARHQQIKAARLRDREKAKAAGRDEARKAQSEDRALMAVWTQLPPDVRAMKIASDLTLRLSKRPEWRTKTHAQRVASTTAFIRNYSNRKSTRRQGNLDQALGTAAYHALPDWRSEFQAIEATPPRLPAIEPIEVPDLFTINRQLNWKKPGHYWMNQMLKDIDAAKAAGDTANYQDLTKRYSAWAEKSLRRDEDTGR